MKKNYEMPMVEVVVLQDVETADHSALVNFWEIDPGETV